MEELILKEIREARKDINKLDTKIDQVEVKLNNKIEEVKEELNDKIEELNDKIEEVKEELNSKIYKVEKEIINEYRGFTMVVYKKQREANEKIDKNHNEFKKYKGNIKQFMNSFENIVV